MRRKDRTEESEYLNIPEEEQTDYIGYDPFSIDRDLSSYEHLTDEELIGVLRKGDKDAEEVLIQRYKWLVKVKSRTYFLSGADRDDIVQEGMIGLYKAIKDYDPDKYSSFRTFSDLCISRQMISAVKRSNRIKNIPLNEYVSFSRTVGDEEGRTVLDLLSGPESDNPEDRVMHKEDLIYIEKFMDEKLTDHEKKVAGLYIEGKSYRDIARILGKSRKSVDSALQRVKKKLENYVVSGM